MGRAQCWGLAAIAALSACSDETRPPADLVLSVIVDWTDTVLSPAELGYVVRVFVNQQTRDERCRSFPPSSFVLVANDERIPLTPSPSSNLNCVANGVALGPYLEAKPVLVQLKEHGEIVAEAHYDGLMPGAAATLVSPADGRVRAGDEIVILPPSSLPTSDPGSATFYPLEAPVWDASGIFATAPRERRFDGIHVQVPAFVGPAVMVLGSSAPSLLPTVSCPGFASCSTVEIDHRIGPVFLEGLP
jgi:hypothetical protein